jgi:hypothetical protein
VGGRGRVGEVFAPRPTWAVTGTPVAPRVPKATGSKGYVKTSAAAPELTVVRTPLATPVPTADASAIATSVISPETTARASDVRSVIRSDEQSVGPTPIASSVPAPAESLAVSPTVTSVVTVDASALEVWWFLLQSRRGRIRGALAIHSRGFRIMGRLGLYQVKDHLWEQLGGCRGPGRGCAWFGCAVVILKKGVTKMP